jgi:hypothetical protein
MEVGAMTQTPGSETPGEPTAAPSEPPAAASPPPTAPPDTTAPPPGYTAPAATTTSGGAAAGLLGSPIAIALCVVGAVLVAVSIFLDWADLSVGSQSFSTAAKGVPIEFLWDKNTSSTDPSLLIALIPAAVAILVGIIHKVRLLAVLGGLVSIVVAGLYVYQVNSGLDQLPESIRSIFDFIGIAPWFALVGGILGLIGGLIPKPKAA